MVALNPILKKSSRKSLNSSASLLGLVAGAVGWSGLAQAAGEEAAAQVLLLPEHYELRENGLAVFKLETGETLSLTADQYLILEDGLLLITDDLAQASISSLPVMGSVRAGLLSELQPVRAFDGSVVKAEGNVPVWSGEGHAPRLSEQVAFERFELAQAQSQTQAQAEAPEEDGSDGDDDDVVAALPGLSGGAGVLAFFGLLMTSEQPGSATEVAPAPAAAPSYNSFAFRLDGVDPDDFSGYSVSSAGDVDGDGKDDILIGAPYAGSNKGEVYLVFGSHLASNPNSVVDLSDLSGGKGVRLDGIDTDDYAGLSVSSAGDVDGDGKDDILVGAYYAQPAGETYLVFGSHLATAETVDLSDLSGGKGVRLDGIDTDDYAGYSVSSAGDVDGDGKDDILIGAPKADVGDNAGETYLIFGEHLASKPASVDLSDLSEDRGILFYGLDGSDQLGRTVSSAGDVDGDGKDDILIGAPFAGSNKGEVYLVFGSYLAENPGTVVDLSDLSGGKGIRLDGIDTGDYAGTSISSAGDVDGDGKDDILIGAWGGDLDGAVEAGETYLVFGSHLATKPTTVDLNALTGGKGVRLEGIDHSDYSGEYVSAAGDIDADGKGDILIGADSAYSSRGEVYLVLGSHLATAETVDLGDLSDGKGILILGIDEDDVAGRVSSAGDVDGDGKDDILIGARGADPEGDFDIGETYLISGHTLDLAIDGIGVANAGVIDLAADFGFG